MTWSGSQCYVRTGGNVDAMAAAIVRMIKKAAWEVMASNLRYSNGDGSETMSWSTGDCREGSVNRNCSWFCRTVVDGCSRSWLVLKFSSRK